MIDIVLETVDLQFLLTNDRDNFVSIERFLDISSQISDNLLEDVKFM